MEETEGELNDGIHLIQSIMSDVEFYIVELKFDLEIETNLVNLIVL